MPGPAKYALYVYDIPVDILQQICTTLDNDKGWKYLAGKCGYNQDKVTSFNLEYYRPHGSPTERLIADWGVRNPTIHDLYEKLRTIDRIREMKLLEPLLQASKEYERQERAQREKEEREAREREAKEKEAKAQEAAKAAKEALKAAQEFEEHSGKAMPMLAQPLTVDGHLTVSNGKYENAARSITQPQENYESVNQLDREKNNLYEQLNLDNSGQKAKTKASQSKELGIELEATHQLHRSYPKMDSSKVNQSELACGAVATSLPPLSSSNKEIDFQMSEDELESAKSLSHNPAGQLAKDLVVAVSATARFTYKELSCATAGFADGNRLGEGSFGDVYIGVLKNSKCAVKRLRQTEMLKAGKDQMDRHVSEIKTLMLYRHENIVQLYGFAVDGDEICLVYQYMENGSLEDRLLCKGDTQPLTWSQRINILLGAARGIQYLHTMDPKHALIHADIKSANILLDKHFEAKISDFGLAKYANAGQQTGMYTHVSKKEVNQKVYKTRAYLPPEFFNNGPSTKSDTYGFGVIILETCTGEKAFDEKRESEGFLSLYACTVMEEQPEEAWPNNLVDSRAGPPPTHIHLPLKLARQCISERKKDRPTMTEALKQLECIESSWNEVTTFAGPVVEGQDTDPSQGQVDLSQMMYCGNNVIEGKQMAILMDPNTKQCYAVDPAMIDQRAVVADDNGAAGGHFIGVGIDHSANPPAPVHGPANQLGRSSLPRMSSLPDQPNLPWVGAKRLTKSHSLDEVPESLRLQRMYDEHQYKEKLKIIGQEVFAEESVSSGYVDDDGPTIEEMYPSNPEKLAALEEEYNSLDSNASDKTLTEASVEDQLSENEDNLGSADEIPQLCDNGTDPVKLKAMQDFDEAQRVSDESHCDAPVEEKLKQLQVRETPGAPDSCSGDISEEQPEKVYFATAEESSLDTDTISDQASKMASFFEGYKAELESLNCDEIDQTVTNSSQDQVVEGHDPDPNQGQVDLSQGMVYCGNEVIEGQQMAILMDPNTKQCYAVDPAMIEPSAYHHQQLSYYMQCQSDMPVEGDDASQC